MRYIQWEPPSSAAVPPDGPIATWLWNTTGRVLSRLLPYGNPDFDDRYDRVKRWWLEIDDVGTPVREIGFCDSGSPLVIGPWRDNFGMLTDSNVRFPDAVNDVLVERSFEAEWDALVTRWGTWT